MKNKKNLLMILLFIVCIIVGLESYTILNKFYKVDNNDSNVDNSKYLVDLSKPYYRGSLSYNFVNEGNKYYKLIDGLKDEKIEKKVNLEIEKKIDEISTKYPDKYIFGMVISNFSNTLSIAIELTDDESLEMNLDRLKEDTTYVLEDQFIDGINFDLTTGNQLDLYDVVDNKNNFIDKVLPLYYESFSKDIGYFCSWQFVSCYEHYKPDYSKLEDNLFSVINSLKKGRYTFAFTNQYLYLKVNDVYVYVPKMDYDYIDEENKGNTKFQCDINSEGTYHYTDDFGSYSLEICLYINNFEKSYTTGLSLYKLADILTIYDKFETVENIYSTERIQEDIKFFETDYDFVKVKEEDNYLYLYNVTGKTDIPNVVFDDGIDEIVDNDSDDFNYYIIDGKFDDIGSFGYHYVGFDVWHINIDKESYNLNRKEFFDNIYLKSLYYYILDNMFEFNEEDSSYNLFLKKYNAIELYYSYVYDEDWNLVKIEDLLPSDFVNYIPDSWLSLGNYKSKSDMIKGMLILKNTDKENKEVLVLRDWYDEKTLEYQGNIIRLDNFVY